MRNWTSQWSMVYFSLAIEWLSWNMEIFENVFSTSHMIALDISAARNLMLHWKKISIGQICIKTWLMATFHHVTTASETRATHTNPQACCTPCQSPTNNLSQSPLTSLGHLHQMTVMTVSSLWLTTWEQTSRLYHVKPPWQPKNSWSFSSTSGTVKMDAPQKLLVTEINYSSQIFGRPWWSLLGLNTNFLQLITHRWMEAPMFYTMFEIPCREKLAWMGSSTTQSEIPHNEHHKCIHQVHTFHAQDGMLTLTAPTTNCFPQWGNRCPVWIGERSSKVACGIHQELHGGGKRCTPLCQNSTSKWCKQDVLCWPRIWSGWKGIASHGTSSLRLHAN